MAEENNVQDRIEAYFLGEMNPQEEAAFEQEIGKDAELAAEVAAFKNLQSELSLLDEADFLVELGEWGQEMAVEPHPYPEARRFRRKWPIAIAAAILLLLLPAILLLRPDADSRLFSQYFEAYPDVVSARSNDSPSFNQAMEAYNAGDYSAALPYFNEFLKAFPGDADGLFYGGIAELEAGDPLIAQERFAELEALPSLYANAAKWYKALSHIKTGNHTAAKGILLELKSGSSQYATQAAELLEAL